MNNFILKKCYNLFTSLTSIEYLVCFHSISVIKVLHLTLTYTYTFSLSFKADIPGKGIVDTESKCFILFNAL